MADLDQFDEQIFSYIKDLSAPDARTRRQAAIWLGEAGAPVAITKLRQLYLDEDEDPRVRSAAAYSLGMMRALEQALANPETEEQAMKGIQAVAEGKLGRRVPVPVRTVRYILFGMVISLLILLAFSFLIWPAIYDPTAEDAPAPQDVEAGDVRAEAVDLLRLLRADAAALQAQYQAVLGGGAVDCTAFFANPAPLLIADEADPALAAIAADLNMLQADLEAARAPYRAACGSDAAAPTTAEVGPALGSIANTITPGLDAVEAALAADAG